MNGMIPDFIRGMRMVRYQFFRFKSCQKLLLLSPETVCFHVRLCSSKSVHNLIRTSPAEGKEELEGKRTEEPESLEVLVKDRLTRDENIKSLVTELSSHGDVDSLGSLLLKTIPKLTNVTSEKQINLAGHVLEALRSLKVPITEEHYLGLLAFYSESKYFPKLDELLLDMKKDGVQSSKTLQQEISKCLLKMGKPEELEEMVKKLNEAGVGISESVHVEPLYSYAASGDTSRAMEEYDKLLKEGKYDERDLQVSLVRGIIRHGNEDQVRDKLADFIGTGLQFTDNEIYSMFESILAAEHLHLIPYVVHALGKDVMVNSFPSVLTKLIHETSIDKVFGLLCSVYDVKPPSGVSTFEFPATFYKCYIDELHAMNRPVSDIIQKCKELRKIEECHYALEYLLHKYLTKKEISESVVVIYALAECGASIEQTYFWPLFIQAYENFNTEGVLHVVQIMFSVGTYPESETLIKYVYPYLDARNITKYFKVISLSGRFYEFLTEVYLKYALQNDCLMDCAHLLKKRPLNPNVSYYFLKEPFMTALTTGKISQELVKLLKITNALDPFDVLQYLWNAGELDRMRKLLQFLVQEKVPGRNLNKAETLCRRPNIPHDIKVSIQELMNIKPRGKLRSQNSSRFETEVEKESMYECLEIIRNAEIHISELEYKNMNVTGQLFKLLKYYMKVGLYDQALKVRERLMKNVGDKVELTPSYIACMCRLCDYEGKYEEAMNYYLMVKEKYPKFLFDVPKITGLCVIFIRLGAFDELMDLLERMPQWWGSLAPIEHKMVGILKAVAALGDPEMTKTVFDILLRKNVIAITSNTLQCFVETYLKMGKIDEAVNELKRIISDYKIIPSPMVLLWEIITNRKFDKLEETLGIIIKYSDGKDFIIISTLRTLAFLGDVEILDKYFKMYNISLTDKRLPHVLRWEYFGGDLGVRMTAFETFISNAETVDAKNFYADLAVEHVCCDRNGEAAEKLRNFLGDQQILDKFEGKLRNVIALTNTFNKYGLLSLSGKEKTTIWLELIP